MTDRGIIFSGPMVRMLLANRKSQTRRKLKPQPETVVDGRRAYAATQPGHARLVRTAEVGDRLWVRERWQAAMSDNGPCILFHADKDRWYPDWTGPDEGRGPSFDYDRFPADYSARAADVEAGGPWASPVHLTRWASRLTLTVTDVRVQRLWDIGDEDALAEGVWNTRAPDGTLSWTPPIHPDATNAPRRFYIDLWETLHGFGSWGDNPWVVASTFTVQRRDIDAPATREAALA